MDFARELAKRNIEAFERSGADVYVVNAAGCGSALKEYAELLRRRSAWAARAASFSERVRDVTEVLDALELGRGDAFPRRNGHLSRAVSSRSRATRRRSAAPIAGAHSGIASRRNGGERGLLRERRNLQPHATGDGVAAAAPQGRGDPADRRNASWRLQIRAARLQVAAGLRDAGYRATVKHIVELLDEAYE